MCISGRGRLKHDRQTADRYQVPNHRGVLTDPVRDSIAPRREGLPTLVRPPPVWIFFGIVEVDPGHSHTRQPPFAACGKIPILVVLSLAFQASGGFEVYVFVAVEALVSVIGHVCVLRGVYAGRDHRLTLDPKTQTAPRREARGCGLLVPTYVQAKHAEHDREIL